MLRIKNPFWNLALKNPGVVIGGLVFCTLVVFSIIGPHLTPYDAYKMNIRDRLKRDLNNLKTKENVKLGLGNPRKILARF